MRMTVVGVRLKSYSMGDVVVRRRRSLQMVTMKRARNRLTFAHRASRLRAVRYKNAAVILQFGCRISVSYPKESSRKQSPRRDWTTVIVQRDHSCSNIVIVKEEAL